MFEFIKKIIEAGAGKALSTEQFFEAEISRWKQSQKRKDMIDGERYYEGQHDILKRRRTIISQDGILQAVDNLPNNRIVDNQYAKAVDQKVNYLLSKPLTFDTQNTDYGKALKSIFNKRFLKTLKSLGEDCMNGGVGWLYPYYNAEGELCFKRFSPHEILPFWKDSEHTVLDVAIRLYEIEVYDDGAYPKTLEKVEIYTDEGIRRYDLINSKLVPDAERPFDSYMVFEGKSGEEANYNWGKLPLVAFRYNNKELPLILRVKSIQDGINMILSDFENNMQEDLRNTILVIKNLDGTNLSEFRHNLATYGAVKVKTVDGVAGEVDTLKIEVNAENYKAILQIFKKALIENARCFDAKDDRIISGPNQLNIKSMYSDIDLDANSMETEFQASFEQLLWFVNAHISNCGFGNFESEKVDIIFNRDVLINETESIDNCVKSVGLLSRRSITAQHPWVCDVDEELKRMRE